MRSPTIWRWLALASVIVNVAFNYLFAADGSMTQVTDTYRTVFRPAGYAFSIWGVIYLSWIVFCIYILRPAQLDNPAFESLSKPVIVSSVLSIAWITAFLNYYITTSLIIIATMLIVALIQFRNANRVVTNSSANKWIVLLPFSLYAGWLSVATIANSFIWVKAMGWAGTPQLEQAWAIGALTIAGIAGTAIGLQYRNPFFPLVIAWASLALWAEMRFEFKAFSTAAVIVAIIMGILSIYDLTRRWRERKAVL